MSVNSFQTYEEKVGDGDYGYGGVGGCVFTGDVSKWLVRQNQC